MAEYTELIQQLKTLTAHPPANEAERSKLFDALRPATLALEGTFDTFGRVASCGIQTCVTKAAIDLNIFNILAEASGPKSVMELAEATGAQELLLNRFLRYMAVNKLVNEDGPRLYSASPATRVFANPGWQGGLNHMYNVELPCWMTLPKFLEANGYANISSGTKSPFGVAHDTKLHSFAWAMQPGYRHHFANFNLFMSVFREGLQNWVDVFPSDLLLSEGSTPLFVDVGGGIGHQCALLRHKYPQITRSIILQDLAPPIANALPTIGVKKEVYDFFTPQPIKGAAFYYIKACLHDWPDEHCQQILRAQMDGMGVDSFILIDELILPETGIHYKAANLDITMMCNAGAMERTETEWRHLVESVGLVIKEKIIYDEEMQQGILLLAKA